MSLLSVVEDKIRAEPHVFTELVKILESEPTLRSQAKELVEQYLKGKRELTEYIIETDQPVWDSYCRNCRSLFYNIDVNGTKGG